MAEWSGARALIFAQVRVTGLGEITAVERVPQQRLRTFKSWKIVGRRVQDYRKPRSNSKQIHIETLPTAPAAGLSVIAMPYHKGFKRCRLIRESIAHEARRLQSSGKEVVFTQLFRCASSRTSRFPARARDLDALVVAINNQSVKRLKGAIVRCFRRTTWRILCSSCRGLPAH